MTTSGGDVEKEQLFSSGAGVQTYAAAVEIRMVVQKQNLKAII